ncbi:MAG: hypothetical protein WCO44_10445 [Bacteroidota bacterium]
MSEQTVIIHISGYWREESKSEIKKSPGLFFVYETHGKEGDQSLDLLRLIYIGETDNIRAAIADHDSHNAWQKSIKPGNELCYAVAQVDSFLRKRVKAAYVLTHKPPANPDTQAPFPYDKTTLLSTGRTALINPVITLKKNTPACSDTAMYRLRNEMIPVRTTRVFSFASPARRYAIGE